MIPRAKLLPLDILEDLNRFGYENSDNSFHNALEIIEQMPEETTIQKNGDTWNCWFKVSHFYSDFRGDTCPHKAAALAYIAWKKGIA